MSLKTVRRLYVTSSDGEHEIQLCFGDISALPVDDKVDVILISAFTGDYSPTSGTVIGALQNNLKLSVRNLSMNRLEDLRKMCHCWISHNLPEHLPYRQLVCFEKTKEHHDVAFHQAVAEIFRAMMPIFNNTNKSVITPLLATGCQHANEAQMLEALIQAAINWMRAGLPLSLLKIVVYCRHSPIPDGFASDLVDIFKRFEKKVMKITAMQIKDPDILYDSYLIYSSADNTLAQQVRRYLQQPVPNKKLKLVTLSDITTNDSTWQYDIVMAMMSSASIVPLLTTSFLADSHCLDQYNLATCADRRTHRQLLMPFCCENLTDLPVYMTAVQWFDCRSTNAKVIQEACKTLRSRISKDNLSATGSLHYDVFVSYCHRNSDKALLLIKELETVNKDLRVFFDKSELRTGDRWQETLYKALDNTRCVIALVTSAYLQSNVCNEELNLAALRHLSAKSELVLLCMDDVKADLPLFRFVRPVRISKPDNFGMAIKLIAKSVCTWFEMNSKDEIFSPLQMSLDTAELRKKQRQQKFESDYKLECTSGIKINYKGTISKSAATPVEDHLLISKPEHPPPDVFLSYAAQDRRYASFLAVILRDLGLLVVYESSAEDAKFIESSRCVVVFLSDSYCQSSRKIEELHLSLIRARLGHPIYVILIGSLPPAKTPTYIQLVECGVCISDHFWTEKIASCGGSAAFDKALTEKRKLQEAKHGELKDEELLAILKASCDVELICRLASSDLASCQKGVLLNVIDLYISTENTLPPVIAAYTIDDQIETAAGQQPCCNSDDSSSLPNSSNTEVVDHTTASDLVANDTKSVASDVVDCVAKSSDAATAVSQTPVSQESGSLSNLKADVTFNDVAEKRRSKTCHLL